MPLLLAGPLQPALNRGHGVRRVDERENPQGEAIRHKAGEGVGAQLAFACARLGLDNPEQTGRHT